MLRNYRVVLGCLLLAGALAAHAAPEPVALVTELSGTGAVAQKPDDGALESLHELLPGAVVTLSNGAHAVVVHTASGAVYDLSGPGRFRVQSQSIDALNDARLTRRELPPEIKSFQLKPLSAMQASIVMRGTAPVRLDGPNGGVLGTDELNYRIRGNVVAPTFEVAEVGGATIVATKEASTGFNPANTVALQPGRHYVLVVKGTDSGGRPVELSSRFWLIGSESAARLKAAKPVSDATTTDLIVYALVLESAGATATARETWRVVNERR